MDFHHGFNVVVQVLGISWALVGRVGRVFLIVVILTAIIGVNISIYLQLVLPHRLICEYVSHLCLILSL